MRRSAGHDDTLAGRHALGKPLLGSSRLTRPISVLHRGQRSSGVELQVTVVSILPGPPILSGNGRLSYQGIPHRD